MKYHTASRLELFIDGAEMFTGMSAYSRQDGMILAVKDEKHRAQVLLTDASDMRRLAGFLLAEAQRRDPLPDSTPNPASTPDQLT